MWAALQLAQEELDVSFSWWDISCFAAQWIAQISMGQLDTDTSLHPIARALNQWLHHHHYFYAEELFDAE